MTRGFTKQPEGVAAYKKYGFPYEDEVMPDATHEKFMRQTEKSPEQLNICYIPTLRRIKTGMKGEEYLTFSLMYRRVDSISNWHHSFLPNMGIVPKLQPVTRMKRDDQGWESKYIAKLDLVGKQYIIPFEGKKSIQKLIKKYGEDSIRDKSTEEGRQKVFQAQARREEWAEKNGKTVRPLQGEGGEWTQFMINKEGEHYKIPVNDYSDWVTGDFEELYRYGKIRTPLEKRYDEMRRFGRELSNEEREIEMSIPFIVAPGNKLDTMTETAEMEFRKARGEDGPQYK